MSIELKYAFSLATCGTSFSVSKEKGLSLIQLFKYIKLTHNLGLFGSTVKGTSIFGGAVSFTLPIHSMIPLCKRSLIVSFMNGIKDLHLFELLKCLLGGKSQSYVSPQNSPLKGLRYWRILTPTSTHFLTSSLAEL